MNQAGFARWLQEPPVKGWLALACGMAAVWLPTVVRAAVNGVVTGCEFTPYIPFVLICAILFRWWQAAIVALVNAVTGTLIAWVLVRDDFRGKRFVNAIIDLPFALPTIVASIVLLSLYGPKSPVGIDVANTRIAVFLALAFVTLPFVVRTTQPVLEALERDVEEAAASLGASRLTTFRRIILPSLLPAITAGAALSFARAIGEYGSLVLLSGNLPNRTEVASVRILSYLENGSQASAASVATILLVVALVVIVGLDILQRRVARRGE